MDNAVKGNVEDVVQDPWKNLSQEDAWSTLQAETIKIAFVHEGEDFQKVMLCQVVCQ
jgi:hypothetical protein